MSTVTERRERPDGTERPIRGSSAAARGSGRASARGAPRRPRSADRERRTRSAGPERAPRAPKGATRAAAGTTTRSPAPARPAPQPAPRPATRPQRTSTTPGTRPARAPFVLLLIGLLGGGLVSLLLVNTVLAQGSFQLDTLRDRHTQLTHRVEALQQEVAYQSSPEVLSQKARSLGMVPSDNPVFLDPGKRRTESAGGGERAGPRAGGATR